uniref:Enoyl CoA hydratase domain containing 2 n=1 Tax=Sinocyclocheilus grahami TaxID=75366 RepID=A0A672Q870_SINGR
MTFVLFAFTVIKYKHLILYLFIINIQTKQTSLGWFNVFLSLYGFSVGLKPTRGVLQNNLRKGLILIMSVVRSWCSDGPVADRVEVGLNRLDGEDNGIMEVLMCRERARNSLGRAFVGQRAGVIVAAVRVVVFRSLIPGVFCAGADLKERAQMSNPEAELFVQGLRSLMNDIAALPMPTIAAVDGFALGCGLELALVCDIRTAAHSAQMGMIETTRGLLPGAGGSQRLPRTVGFAIAEELIFTGGRVGGERAAELGLVNRSMPQNQTGDAAHKEALSLAREILPQVSLHRRAAFI